MNVLDVRNGRVDVEVPTDEDAKQCARLLKDPHANLKSIDLRRGLVTSAGAGTLAKALKGNTSLRHLGIPGNSIGDVGVAAIGRAVEGNLGCSLTYIDLSATGITVVGLSNLVQGVSGLPGLHTVCLNDNNLAQEAGLQLSNLLKASSSLHTVLAGGNYLGDRGLAALCGSFCYLKPARVLSLDVSGNGIGDLGAQWLCKGISALCRSQSRESIGPGGVSTSSGIRDLRLRGNNITHTGARELAKLLSEDRCGRDLRELDLSMNTITADGFRPLAVSLRGCRELVRLDFAGCRLGPGGLDAAADLIAAATLPKLRSVILTPKAEFADRVLGDRGGLAVALRQSLQRLADSLPFAGAVVEVGLGAFLRADPVAAAGIEETLRERRERAAEAASSERTGAGGGGGGGGVSGGGGGGGEGGKRGPAAAAGKGGSGGGGGGGGSSRPGDKSRNNNTTNNIGGTGASTRAGGGGRARADGPGTPTAPPSSSGGRRGGGGTPRSGSGIPSTPGSSGRSRHGARGTGIERPRAGMERHKSGIAERPRRGAGTPRSSPTATPPTAPLHRTSSKSSVKGGGTGKGSSERSSRQQQQQQKTTAATLAARDRAAAAAAPHKRMHQGEELDSIEGFSTTEPRHEAAPPPPPMTPSSSRRQASGKAASSSAAGTKTAHTSQADPAFFGDGAGNTSYAAAAARAVSGGAEGNSAPAPAPSPPSAVPAGGVGGVVDSIADVVSKVMGDTAAMVDDQVSPPPVAPSTWEWGDDGGGGGGGAAAVAAEEEEAAKADGRRRVSAESSSSAPLTEAVERREKGAAGGRGGGERKALSRKSSAASFSTAYDNSGEPELSAGLVSLAVGSERRPSPSSRSQETTTTLDVSSGGGGGGSQQLVTVAEAGRMLAPLVAQEVEKEAKKIEIRMQNEMNVALRTMRSEMEAIDREGLMARVAMEKRLKTGIKRLLDRIDHLERRFAKLEREDRKRLALEAAATTAAAAAAVSPPAAPALTNGNTAAATATAAVTAAAAAEAPESRPLVLREAFGGGGGGGDGAMRVGSSIAASEEDFSESGDESEADIVRMLEEKMAALEGKLLGHEERQRSDPRAGEGAGVGMMRMASPSSSSAVWA